LYELELEPDLGQAFSISLEREKKNLHRPERKNKERERERERESSYKNTLKSCLHCSGLSNAGSMVI
jgi:hypothetical protein